MSLQVQNVTVLGATGSIGTSTLDVIARHPDRYRVYALTGHRQLDKLFELCCQHRPQVAVLADEADAQTLRQRLHAHDVHGIEVASGPDALVCVSAHPQVDTVMAAIVGAAGLPPALAAAEAGKRVLLANKEALVMSGSLFMDAVARSGAVLLPIDSEHNAVFQSLPAHYTRNPASCGVRRVILTASGGPFRTRDLATLEAVTPAEAVAHPNWSMGRKISVDSATMMNKGLEVIEARWLFNVPPEAIEVVIHPQSMIHSLVDYVDGSVLAELGNPDMRTPIAHALAYPERIASGVAPLDFRQLSALTFETPDLQRFPCLQLAFDALAIGGAAPAVLNAANEVAVEAFLGERLGFMDIARLNAAVLADCGDLPVATLADVMAADAQARVAAQHWLDHRVPA